MSRYKQPGGTRGCGWRPLCAWLLAPILCATANSCGSQKQELIAFIPQTDGMMLWDSAHAGAETAASRTGSSIYWNAPMREDDIAAQVRLVNKVASSSRYQGLVIAPTQALSLVSPVRRALARGIPTVIIDSPLSLPPGGKLSYILNDDEAAGRMAADRVARAVPAVTRDAAAVEAVAGLAEAVEVLAEARDTVTPSRWALRSRTCSTWFHTRGPPTR